MQKAVLEPPVAGPTATRTQPKRPRVQLDFTPEAYARLKELVELAELDSIPEMFRDALRVYEWYQVRKSEGYRLLLQKDKKTVAVDLGL